MKKLALVFCAVLIAGFVYAASTADKPAKSTRLHHVVAFKFKEGTSKEQIQRVEDAFRNLKSKIKEIKGYEWGTNVSPEKHDKGFTHGFILTFNSAEDRDTYLNHPEHKAFGGMVGPVLGDVFVIDFWAQN
jgi:heme-degrading monooxygenase HmoA